MEVTGCVRVPSVPVRPRGLESRARISTALLLNVVVTATALMVYYIVHVHVHVCHTFLHV